MGFLDHSTNNIIIDAVLTDFGRKLLAENQGAFKIAFFSLADDEVDYTTIRKFGRTVGKEKISKNTPVYEAQTLSSTAMKHRLITLPDPIVNRMPTLKMTSLEGFGAEGEFITEGSGGKNTVLILNNEPAVLTFKQHVVGGKALPTGLTDATFTVLCNDRFLAIGGTANLIDTEPYSKVSAYTLPAKSTNNNAATVDVTILRQSIGPTGFTQFGDSANKEQITSIVSVIGDQSGIRKDIKVTIQKV